MKILCFILSIYVIFLSTVNCCLDDNCADGIEIARTDNHSQDHKEKGDCNNCSPFLNCGTCSGFIFTSLQIDIIEIPFQKDKSVVVYKSRFSNTFSNEFWQPPKIS